jgi:hypothetical protein
MKNGSINSKKIQHYLISIPLRGGYIHGYVMTNQKDILPQVAERLMQEAETLGARCWPPIILQTHLSTGWKLVRDIITKNQGMELAKNWKTVKKFHLTGWIMTDDNPDTEQLMKLH